MNEQMKKRLEQMDQPINALAEAVALADFYHDKQAKAAQQALNGTKDLIKAVLEFIYQQPQRSDNFEQYEPILEALSSLGYRYCEGCDRWMSSTKERDDLPGGIALCDECDQDTRTKLNKENQRRNAELEAEQTTLQAINNLRKDYGKEPLTEEQAWELFQGFIYDRTPDGEEKTS